MLDHKYYYIKKTLLNYKRFHSSQMSTTFCIKGLFERRFFLQYFIIICRWDKVSETLLKALGELCPDNEWIFSVC